MAGLINSFKSLFTSTSASTAAAASNVDAPSFVTLDDLAAQGFLSCANCPDPCLNLPEEIDRTSALEGTAKVYNQHFLICGVGKAHDWPGKVEDQAVLQIASKAAKDAGKSAGLKIFVSACEKPLSSSSDPGSLDTDMVDILAMPQCIEFKNVSKDDVSRVITECVGKQQLPENVQAVQLREEKGVKGAVFVCGHNKRDARCGIIGPLLVDEFKKALAAEGLEDSVMVHLISHVGGHKFAGNVIIYPEGHWYGRVSPKHAADIVRHHIIDGKVIKDLWRGQMERSDALSW